MVTVMPPWVIAAGNKRTSAPITMVPVRELTTTFADGLSGSNSKSSNIAKKLTRSAASRGAETLTEAESSALAEPAIKLLIVSDKRLAVLKSALRRLKVI